MNAANQEKYEAGMTATEKGVYLCCRVVPSCDLKENTMLLCFVYWEIVDKIMYHKDGWWQVSDKQLGRATKPEAITRAHRKLVEKRTKIEKSERRGGS